VGPSADWWEDAAESGRRVADAGREGGETVAETVGLGDARRRGWKVHSRRLRSSSSRTVRS